MEKLIAENPGHAYRSHYDPQKMKPRTKSRASVKKTAKSILQKKKKTLSGENPNVLKRTKIADLYRAKNITKRDRSTWQGYLKIDEMLFPKHKLEKIPA